MLAGVEKGTIHTKRHSGEDPLKCGTPKAEGMKSMSEFSTPKTRANNSGNVVGHISEDVYTPTTDDVSMLYL